MKTFYRHRKTVSSNYLTAYYLGQSLSPPNSPSTKSTKDSEVPNNIDIVDLLKDICGSVHDLKTEMGQNGLRDVSKFDLLHAEDGNHHNIRIAEMSGIKQLNFNIWKLRNIHYMF